MITLTLDAIPQRPIQVDEETIRDIDTVFDSDGETVRTRVLFSSGQWLPVTESEEEIWQAVGGL